MNPYFIVRNMHTDFSNWDIIRTKAIEIIQGCVGLGRGLSASTGGRDYTGLGGLGTKGRILVFVAERFPEPDLNDQMGITTTNLATIQPGVQDPGTPDNCEFLTFLEDLNMDEMSGDCIQGLAPPDVPRPPKFDGTVLEEQEVVEGCPAYCWSGNRASCCPGFHCVPAPMSGREVLLGVPNRSAGSIVGGCMLSQGLKRAKRVRELDAEVS
ncbi:MAG: hypothetical protein M1827_007593 [Pycnora praestabilis]|nr:MAG: hypothetical protein M1827_007593 [Pycnora praestabilis]